MPAVQLLAVPRSESRCARLVTSYVRDVGDVNAAAPASGIASGGADVAGHCAEAFGDRGCGPFLVFIGRLQNILDLTDLPSSGSVGLVRSALVVRKQQRRAVKGPDCVPIKLYLKTGSRPDLVHVDRLLTFAIYIKKIIEKL